MNITSIATLGYIGLLLVYGVISAAITYHLHRYYLRNDRTQQIMGIVYFAVSGIFVGLATYFFLTVEWELISSSLL